MYREVLSPTDREHLVTNIVAHASAGVTPEVQARVIDYWPAARCPSTASCAAGGR